MRSPITVSTSNGPVVLWYTSMVWIDGIGNVECVYNPKGPPCLSVGRLVEENSVSFSWDKGGCSYKTSEGEKVSLDVSEGIPTFETFRSRERCYVGMSK